MVNNRCRRIYRTIEKINRYNEEVRPYKTETLTTQNETVNLYVLSRYNYPSVPLTPSWRKMSDAVVDTASSSFGATCADYGDKFSDEYVASRKDKSTVNPDHTICSETCLFPEQTWFIKDMQHAIMNGDMDNMVKEFLHYDGQATVTTFENYPRFLAFNEKDATISIDNGTPEVKKTALDYIKGFFLKILEINRKILDLIFFWK